MNKALPILLLCMFVMYISGYLLLFQLKHTQLVNSIESRSGTAAFASGELITFMVPQSDTTDGEKLIWKDSKEFMYNGSMYDCLSREVRENKIIYSCFQDEEENLLFATLDKFLKDTSSAGKKEARQLIKLLFTQYTTPESGYQIGYNESPGKDGAYTFNLKTWTIPPGSYPPEKQFIS